MTRTVRGMLLVAAILAFTAGTASAQATGSIFGKVTDSTGATLPGVTVTVTGTGLQQPLVNVTQQSGAYQFPVVPIGTYSVKFEANNFKTVVRQGVIITDKFDAPVNAKMEIGAMTDTTTVSGAAPVVDTKKTTTGGTFTKDILDNIPTSRDPWQIIAMAPGVQNSGNNVGGSSSGQQPTLNSRGTSANVQWNLEGGNITDMSSNSSPSYFNFDSFEQIAVTTGGGDVSVQSSGLSINLTTKSGSNVFKGTATGEFENSHMQSNNVSQALFNASSTGFLSGNPLKKINTYDGEAGGPIFKNKLWYWGASDRQDINVGDLNYFDPTLGSFCQTLIATQKSGANIKNSITYGQLKDVQNCLTNDQTLITDVEWKLNYQLNSSNKFQWLFDSDNKVRNHRSASANTATADTYQQYSSSGYLFGLPLPTDNITHTWIASDKLVFTNQYTYVGGGFFLDFQDWSTCGSSAYTGSADAASYTRAASCLWNQQLVVNRTTGYKYNGANDSYATVRKGQELKTDATYFMSKFLGGDHSLKFGVGYRQNPVQTFIHYGGGAEAEVQCVGNNLANCGDGVTNVPVGSATGLVPYAAFIERDELTNYKWWTYNGYLQDSYSRGRLRINGGARYDWQQSRSIAGCLAPNLVLPTALPSECQITTETDPTTGKNIQSFGNVSPRVSATYDLTGNGKTSINASYSYYYDSKITLASALAQLNGSVYLTYGANQSSGACSTVSGASCWNDANNDGIAQANELIGIPSSSSSRFNTTTGVLSAAGNLVDPSAKIGRTREGIVGVSHEVMANMAVSVDYTYRNYDEGTQSFTIGYAPGQASLSALYTGPTIYADPTSGVNAPYYTVCVGCMRPSGIGSITETSPNYRIYHGVDITANKRFSNRWQLNAALTMQNNPSYTVYVSNPTGLQYTNGISTLSKYVFKLQGSVQLPYGIMTSVNWNWNNGSTRTISVYGPGNVYGGVNSAGANTTISYSTLTFQNADTVRFAAADQVDLGAQKVFTFRGGKNRFTLMLDAFNILNIATVQSYSGGNEDVSSSFTTPTTLFPPRVLRVGVKISF